MRVLIGATRFEKMEKEIKPKYQLPKNFSIIAFYAKGHYKVKVTENITIKIELLFSLLFNVTLNTLNTF